MLEAPERVAESVKPVPTEAPAGGVVDTVGLALFTVTEVDGPSVPVDTADPEYWSLPEAEPEKVTVPAAEAVYVQVKV